MITHEDFIRIDSEVSHSITQLFDFVKNKSMYYITFLANGEYKPTLENSHLNLNPYSIDNREDRYKDADRMSFLIEFMRTFYGFRDGVATDDNESRLHMELMVYTHIWESKPFLKQLYRLSALAQGFIYPWKVEVPDMSKHDFIRNTIREPLRRFNLTLVSTIERGFHTTLRNAFAHSEYYFNKHTNEIILDSYTGKAWDINKISYNDWSLRFAYSVLLTYHFQNTFFQRRLTLITDYGTAKFVIAHPITSNRTKARIIEYDPLFDTFHFDYL